LNNNNAATVDSDQPSRVSQGLPSPFQPYMERTACVILYQRYSFLYAGHRESFFTIFDLLTKEDKLEFYLKVYFLIYSIHPHLNQNSKNSVIPEK
jgi:hypothetical protein